MGWRNCRASLSLLDEVNRRWPGRSKVSDGTIGDSSHATRSSDHNPWLIIGGQGIVRARDITAKGIDAAALCEYLRQRGQARDNRLTDGGYLIFNRRITKPDFSGWKAYTGSNPHTSHLHVSFSQLPAGFDAVRPWGITGATTVPGKAAPTGGDFMSALSDVEQREILEIIRRFRVGVGGVYPAGDLALSIRAAADNTVTLGKAVDALLARPPAQVDTNAVVTGVVDAISRAGLAPLVADELARRLAS